MPIDLSAAPNPHRQGSVREEDLYRKETSHHDATDGPAAHDQYDDERNGREHVRSPQCLPPSPGALHSRQLKSDEQRECNADQLDDEHPQA